MKDIETTEDIQLMVDTFYERVNEDNLLSPVFNEVAEVDWLEHLPKLYQFWKFLILGITGYQGQPFPKHVELPITAKHFERWLHLFQVNIDAQFRGPNAEAAKHKARNIGAVFQHRLGLT